MNVGQIRALLNAHGISCTFSILKHNSDSVLFKMIAFVSSIMVCFILENSKLTNGENPPSPVLYLLIFGSVLHFGEKGIKD